MSELASELDMWQEVMATTIGAVERVPRVRPADERLRKTSRTQGEQGQWDPIVGLGGGYEVILKLLQSNTLREELGGAEWSSGTRKPPVGFNKKGVARRELRCPYRGKANCSCGALLRVNEHESGGWSLDRKRGVPHADHTKSNKKRGLPKYIAYEVTSPTKMKLPASEVKLLKKEVREKLGAPFKAKLSRQVSSLRQRKKRKEQDPKAHSSVLHRLEAEMQRSF